MSEDELDYMTEQMNSMFHSLLIAVDYNLAHNIIYGAVEFAEEFGINPAKEFEFTKMILE